MLKTNMANTKSIKIKMTYFAALTEISGLSEENIQTNMTNPSGLYQELKSRFKWPLHKSQVMVAVNDEYVDMEYLLQQGDNIVFIPPVAGG